jgi:uncharacterized protein
MPTRPLNRNRTGLVDLFGVALLFLFLILFVYADRIQDESSVQVPQAWLNVSTIFLSIVLEAAPFVLLGVFVSALIQVYVREEVLQRFLPKHPVKALLPATVMGAILPICECAIVPVVRRLIHKGMPLHCGVVFLVAAPILNPVVVASTFFAFRTNLEVLYARVGLAFLLAIVIGWVMYVVFRHTSQLKQTVRHVGSHQEEHQHVEHVHGSYAHSEHDDAHQDHDQHQHNGHASPPFWHRLKQTLNHAADEFFDMGKYLIIGAFIAALFQTFLDRQILLSIGSGEWSSTLVMMAFAFYNDLNRLLTG